MKKRSSFKVKSCKQTKSYLWSSNILTYKQKYKIATIVKLQKRKKRQKTFIKKLNAKRKLAFLYGRLSKKTIKSLKKQAIKIKTNSTTGVGKKLLCLLERRLDSCLFRIDFFRSFSEARQYIKHGHILVNSKVVNLCSFMLKPGDIISIKYPTSLEEINNVNYLSNLLFKYQTYKTINSKIKDLFKKKLFSPTPASSGRYLTIESRKRPQLLRNSKKGLEEVKKSKIYYRDSFNSPRRLTSPRGVGSSRAPQGRDSTISSRGEVKKSKINWREFFTSCRALQRWDSTPQGRDSTLSSQPRGLKNRSSSRGRPFIIKKKKRKFFLKKKPQHLEINYKTLTAIYLYTPQQIQYPTYIDVDLALRYYI